MTIFVLTYIFGSRDCSDRIWQHFTNILPYMWLRLPSKSYQLLHSMTSHHQYKAKYINSWSTWIEFFIVRSLLILSIWYNLLSLNTTAFWQTRCSRSCTTISFVIKGLEPVYNDGSEPMEKWFSANFFKKIQFRQSLYLCPLKNIKLYLSLCNIWKIIDNMYFWWEWSSKAAQSNCTMIKAWFFL